MKSIIAFLIIFTLNVRSITAQEIFLDSYYIWAKSGLSLRASPDKNAEKIIIIPYRSEVSLISRSNETLTVSEFPGFEYTSNWVKIKYKDLVGYSFLGYLAKIKPPEISDLVDLQNYLNDNFTKTSTEIISKYENCPMENEACIISGVTSYKEGISYSFWNGEAGGSETVSIPNFNILQAFILASTFCPSYTAYKIEYFENPQPTILVYRDTAGCDFSITVLGSVAIIHWSGGC
ncbi:SH3 domain-containing protein [Cellulophaga sp. E16_2]|uniref:SH3 domain-containing protein n=1 Tax=Cellulophaga sp. E16_2 TaxID=2789297 RepID=UPI001A912F95|nr:SH3 domain-containing protein [Cellulophaga sp. E16_2]MBO0593661.1 SH3 domain-containing protein [Cellulophaga sp. E16_2]